MTCCWSSISLWRMIKHVFVVCVIHFAAEAFPICSDRLQYRNRPRFGCRQRSMPTSSHFMVTSEDTASWGSRLDEFSPPWNRHDKLVAEDLPLNLTASYIRRLPPNTRFKYRIRQLMEHKLKYGDYEIASETSGLDKWIRTQRYEYRMRMQGKDSLLTPERMDLLTKIGFDWKLESQDGLTTAWLKSYEELKAYYNEHGHAQLRASDSTLGKWVANQRYQHRRWKRGEYPSSMTDKRRQLLEDAGMVWDYRAEGQTKYDDQWQERYEQLAEFQMENGHCFVSGNSGPLGRWVSNQRKAYQNRLKYNVSTLTERREKLLRNIGFDFDVDGFSAWQNTVWETSYRQLQEFYNLHNHSEFTPNRSPLANWVRQQRREYQRYKEGKQPCSMTQERIEALEKLDFVWTRKHKARRETMQKYKRLREDANNNNVTLLLLDSDMGPWIHRQGLEWNRARRGEETTLTEEQRKLLEELKIDELLVCSKARTPWETSLARLADFQSTYGHTRVTMNHDAGLSRWTKHQRLQYHKRKDGNHSTITLERIKKLESLGFEWTVPIGRPKVDRPPRESKETGNCSLGDSSGTVD